MMRKPAYRKSSNWCSVDNVFYLVEERAAEQRPVGSNANEDSSVQITWAAPKHGAAGEDEEEIMADEQQQIDSFSRDSGQCNASRELASASHDQISCGSTAFTVKDGQDKYDVGNFHDEDSYPSFDVDAGSGRIKASSCHNLKPPNNGNNNIWPTSIDCSRNTGYDNNRATPRSSQSPAARRSHSIGRKVTSVLSRPLPKKGRRFMLPGRTHYDAITEDSNKNNDVVATPKDSDDSVGLEDSSAASFSRHNKPSSGKVGNSSSLAESEKDTPRSRAKGRRGKQSAIEKTSLLIAAADAAADSGGSFDADFENFFIESSNATKEDEGGGILPTQNTGGFEFPAFPSIDDAEAQMWNDCDERKSGIALFGNTDGFEPYSPCYTKTFFTSTRGKNRKPNVSSSSLKETVSYGGTAPKLARSNAGTAWGDDSADNDDGKSGVRSNTLDREKQPSTTSADDSRKQKKEKKHLAASGTAENSSPRRISRRFNESGGPPAFKTGESHQRNESVSAIAHGSVKSSSQYFFAEDSFGCILGRNDDNTSCSEENSLSPACSDEETFSRSVRDLFKLKVKQEEEEERKALYAMKQQRILEDNGSGRGRVKRPISLRLGSPPVASPKASSSTSIGNPSNSSISSNSLQKRMPVAESKKVSFSSFNEVKFFTRERVLEGTFDEYCDDDDDDDSDDSSWSVSSEESFPRETLKDALSQLAIDAGLKQKYLPFLSIETETAKDPKAMNEADKGNGDVPTSTAFDIYRYNCMMMSPADRCRRDTGRSKGGWFSDELPGSFVENAEKRTDGEDKEDDTAEDRRTHERSSPNAKPIPPIDSIFLPKVEQSFSLLSEESQSVSLNKFAMDSVTDPGRFDVAKKELLNEEVTASRRSSTLGSEKENTRRGQKLRITSSASESSSESDLHMPQRVPAGSAGTKRIPTNSIMDKRARAAPFMNSPSTSNPDGPIKAAGVYSNQRTGEAYGPELCTMLNPRFDSNSGHSARSAFRRIRNGDMVRSHVGGNLSELGCNRGPRSTNTGMTDDSTSQKRKVSRSRELRSRMVQKAAETPPAGEFNVQSNRKTGRTNLHCPHRSFRAENLELSKIITERRTSEDVDPSELNFLDTVANALTVIANTVEKKRGKTCKQDMSSSGVTIGLDYRDLYNESVYTGSRKQHTLPIIDEKTHGGIPSRATVGNPTRRVLESSAGSNAIEMPEAISFLDSEASTNTHKRANFHSDLTTFSVVRKQVPSGSLSQESSHKHAEKQIDPTFSAETRDDDTSCSSDMPSLKCKRQAADECVSSQELRFPNSADRKTKCYETMGKMNTWVPIHAAQYPQGENNTSSSENESTADKLSRCTFAKPVAVRGQSSASRFREKKKNSASWENFSSFVQRQPGAFDELSKTTSLSSGSVGSFGEKATMHVSSNSHPPRSSGVLNLKELPSCDSASVTSVSKIADLYKTPLTYAMLWGSDFDRQDGDEGHSKKQEFSNENEMEYNNESHFSLTKRASDGADCRGGDAEPCWSDRYSSRVAHKSTINGVIGLSTSAEHRIPRRYSPGCVPDLVSSSGSASKESFASESSKKFGSDIVPHGTSWERFSNQNLKSNLRDTALLRSVY